jgi:DNA-binding NarL/FixJ family response regulator
VIRVLICDDQAVVCEGLKAILSTVQDIQVVGTAYNGEEALECVEKFSPDVILMDLKMPVMNGIQATRAIRSRFPNTRVIVLTTYDFDEWVFDAIHSGASGYLLKDTPRESLVEAIKGTHDGKTYVDPAVAGKLFERISHGVVPPDMDILKSLSEREVEILKLLSQGLSNPEIATRLYLSEGTVRNYVSSILAKLEVTDRTQAALLALRAGLGG